MKRIASSSQYFLRHPKRVAELIGHTNLSRADTVLDIGAGSGVISMVLATRVRAVIALERDSRMVEKLHKNLSRYDNVTIVAGDVRDVPLPDTPYKVFANIPFAVSSPIVRRLTESESHAPEAMYLIVQAQFANKLRAEGTGYTGLLGALIGPHYSVRIRARLRREDFQPQPAVDTVLVELRRRETPLVPYAEMPAYRQMVSRVFGDPHAYAQLHFTRAGVPADTKPSQLTIQQWALLFAAE